MLNAFGLPRTARSLIIALLLATMLGGCSFTRLGYQNLDWFINWKLRDYVSLDRDQKRWLTGEIRSHLAWHCHSELPRYRPHLLALTDQSLNPDVQAADLAAFIPVWEQEASRTLERLVPTATGLIRRLDERQVTAIERNLALQNQELRERYLGPPLARQNQQRAERTQERLENWLGRLNADQRQRVQLWAETMEGQAGIWLDNREHWQGAFLEALAERRSDDLGARVHRLLLAPQSYWSDSYRAQRQRSTDELLTMVADVLGAADARQREHLQRRAASVIKDLDGMRCAVENS